MKIILTSNGISSEKVEGEFVRLIGGAHELKKKKVLVVRTTRKNPDEYGEEILEELKRVGFNEKNISFVNPFKEEASKEFEKYDVLYSAGGNTFVILNELRKKGYDTLIKKMIKEGKVYLGVSAGTIFLQKSIKIAGIGKTADENYIDLEDLNGLGVIDFVVWPHYEKENEHDIKDYEKKNKIKVIRLKDGECIVVDD
ncbi:MAG: Type 1 glutamine amidotransferase-like domain-containing protein [Nanoarchaeota archaeon]|nr:Type 1 glutamine amidotransferase-like domain-containing protein [Nanoarchaeota archaeon]